MFERTLIDMESYDNRIIRVTNYHLIELWSSKGMLDNVILKFRCINLKFGSSIFRSQYSKHGMSYHFYVLVIDINIHYYSLLLSIACQKYRSLAEVWSLIRGFAKELTGVLQCYCQRRQKRQDHLFIHLRGSAVAIP